MVLGLQNLAGLCSSLLGSHGTLRVGAASVMAPPRTLSVAVNAKTAVPSDDEVLGWDCWVVGVRFRSFGELVVSVDDRGGSIGVGDLFIYFAPFDDNCCLDVIL